MKCSVKLFLLALAMLGSAEASAGCGLFRRGGCSDPCTAGACAGVAFHRGSCGGSAHMGGVVTGGYAYNAGSAYQTAAYADGAACTNYMPSSYVHSGYVQSTVVVNQPAVYAAATVVQQPMMAEFSQPAISAATLQRSDLVDCGPVASYQVVMQPEYATETKYVPYTEYRDETRYRTRTVSRQVPVEVQDYRTKTVMVPTTETKTVEYSVLVPRQEEKTVEFTESVPVWNEVSENYTVKVPTVVDVPEEYTVRVPQLRDETFTYTVQVPQPQTTQRIQRVTNAVPVTKTRTIQVARPVTRTQTVTRDQGHWEMRVEEVASAAVTYSAAPVATISIGGCGTGTTYVNNAGCGSGQATYTYAGCGGCSPAVSSPCGGCGRTAAACGGSGNGGGCGSVATVGSSCGNAGIVYGGISGVAANGIATSGCAAPATQTVTRRVWVPNLVTEEVPVVENVMESQEITYTAFEQQTTEVPYECVTVAYVPEQRTGTRKVVDYVSETRTRNRKVVQYNEETRTRTRKELSYKQESRSQTIPYVSYTTEKRTKEVSFTINVPQTQVEPITTTRYETVQEEVSEEYTVKVPVTSYREQQVQVCRMVPKLVPVTINPCQASVSPSPVSYGTSAGYSGTTSYVSPTIAPPTCNCGSPTLAPAPANCNCQ